MKILVTGVAGFIGSHMAEYLLKNNHQVVGVDNLSDYYDTYLKQQNLNELKHSSFRFIKMDLRYKEEYEQLHTDFDFIFHFAAEPGLSETSTFNSYLENNVIATKRLIDFAIGQPNLKHFFNISTSSVYGKKVNVTEDYIPEPISFYGVTKLAAEQLVLSQSRQGIFSASSLRLYSVYGPRERPDKLFTKLIQCGLSNKKFPLFRGSLMHYRSFTYVGDIIIGIADALKFHRALNGEVLNLGQSYSYSTQEGIIITEKILKKHIHFEELPPRKGDQQETKAIIDKAKRLINYQPKTSLEKGLKDQIDWFKSKK